VADQLDVQAIEISTKPVRGKIDSIAHGIKSLFRKKPTPIHTVETLEGLQPGRSGYYPVKTFISKATGQEVSGEVVKVNAKTYWLDVGNKWVKRRGVISM